MGGSFYKRNQLTSPSFAALCCVLTRFFFKLRLKGKISPPKKSQETVLCTNRDNLVDDLLTLEMLLISLLFWDKA